MEQIDLTGVLAAVIESEGGEYPLSYETFQEVINMQNKAIAFTLSEDGATILLTLVDLEDTDELIVPGK